MESSNSGSVGNYMPDKRKTYLGPWENVAEFQQVYGWIFGEDATSGTRHRALSQMHVWQLRRGALCPAAVLATSVLLRVQLKEEEEHISLTDLQELYAFALIRFFNFMSSTMQGHNMRTMYDTARELGIQSFVVDLRHICAHSAVLPELDMLRSTATYCIRWVQAYYWNPQHDSMCDVDAHQIRQLDKTQLEENVIRLITIYDAALECHMQGATNIKTAKKCVHGTRLAALKEYYTDRNMTSFKSVLDDIVKELSVILRRDVTIKDLHDICIEALKKMKYFYSLADTKDLEKLIDCTQSFFRMLAFYGFIEDYFYGLLAMAENTIVEKTQRAGAGFWALQIATSFVAFRKCKRMYKGELDENPNFKAIDFSTLNYKTISKDVRKLLIYAGVELQRTLLFGDSFRRPWVWIFDRSFLEDRLEALNEYTAPVIKSLLLLIEPALNSVEVKAVDDLIDALYGVPGESDEADRAKKKPASTIYTAGDLLQCLKDENVQSMDIDASHSDIERSCGEKVFGIWSRVPDEETHNWSVCALGRLPWQ